MFCVLQHNDLLVVDVLSSTTWKVIFSNDAITLSNALCGTDLSSRDCQRCNFQWSKKATIA